ncbi:hypothetical protein GJ496_005767 [Pomphorhynchus laevis]|nr:hypothetical protein GJ496_005767 [Pomphorhynchus laevis]
MVRKTRKNITKELWELVVSFSNEHSISKIADLLNIHRHTVRKILSDHESGVTFIPAEKKRIATCRDEIKDIVSEKNNVVGSQPTISRIIKKIGITRKKLSIIPEERNVTERIAARKEYAIDVSRIPDNNLVFLDETGFNEHLKRHLGYSPINNKAYTIVLANKGINRSVICAINLKGIIEYQYRQGSYNANLFIEFLCCVVVPYFSRNPNAIIVMDNARIPMSFFAQ